MKSLRHRFGRLSLFEQNQAGVGSVMSFIKTREELHQLIDSLSDMDVLRVRELLRPYLSNASEAGGNATEATIGEIFSTHFGAIPDEKWERVPDDLAENHDHYLHGQAKR